MFEERPYKLWIVSDVAQLRVDPLLQFLAFLQRASGHTGTLGVAPHQLVRVQVGRIAGQV